MPAAPRLPTIDVILAVDPITPKLSGIGRYTFELAKGLMASVAHQGASDTSINTLRFLWHWKFVDAIDALLQPSVASSIAKNPDRIVHRVLRTVYGATVPTVQSLLLSKSSGAIFHSPNFYLPNFPGKSIATFHDLSVTKYPQWHPQARIAHLKRALPVSLARANAVITPTESVRAELIADGAVDPADVFVVPMGVSSEWFATPSISDAENLAAYGLQSDGYALCIATLEPRKNIVRLLDAYSKLSAPERAQWPLVLCGQAGWLGDDIKRAVSDAVAQGWLRYLGFVPDAMLQVLMRGARCFVFPTLYEGFGLPVLEAMASGTPVVASDIASLREVAADAAAYPSPTDVSAIRIAIEQALCDATWRESSIINGRLRAKRFSWSRTVSETISVYQHVARRI